MATEEESKTIKYTRHNMNLMAFHPLDLQLCSARDIEERCLDYFNMCSADDIRPSIAGFALAIGISRSTLLSYIRGETKCPLDVKCTLDRFYGALNAMIEDYMQSGVINPVSGIFLMKNNFNYSDTQNFVVNNKQEVAISEDKLIEEAGLLTASTPKLANIEE